MLIAKHTRFSLCFRELLIIQDIRAEFEHLLDFVTGEQARTAKADNIERGLPSVTIMMRQLSPII